MHFELNQCYHMYNRGNNRQTIFFREDNFLLFKKKLRDLIVPACGLLGWCLLPGHFHLVLKATEASCIDRNSFGGKPMQILSYKTGLLLSSYSQLMNKQNQTTGSLFQQKTKARPLQSRDDLLRCLHHIHQAPSREGLAEGSWQEWPHSSFQEYKGTVTASLCDARLLFENTGYRPADLIRDSQS